jgi:predicted  nucleic acid-binding Zn-ribbon protein
VDINDPATRQALAACLAMPYTGDRLTDERLDVVRGLASSMEMLEKGRAERTALRGLLARLDQAIADVETRVQTLGERLLQLEAAANAAEEGQRVR